MFSQFDFLPMLDADDGMDIGGTGAEETEAAEPSVDTGAEETEIAEPSTGKTEADSKFAEMRRENERLANENKQYLEALSLFFDGEDKVFEAHKAASPDKTEDQIRAELSAKEEHERIVRENEELKEELETREIQEMIANDLKRIQEIDPSVKSIDDLGDDYLDLIAAGADGLNAYYAVKARQSAEAIKTPAEPGRVNEKKADSDFFTKEQVESMSKAEIKKNYNVIRQSMNKW